MGLAAGVAALTTTTTAGAGTAAKVASTSAWLKVFAGGLVAVAAAGGIATVVTQTHAPLAPPQTASLSTAAPAQQHGVAHATVTASVPAPDADQRTGATETTPNGPVVSATAPPPTMPAAGTSVKGATIATTTHPHAPPMVGAGTSSTHVDPTPNSSRAGAPESAPLPKSNTAADATPVAQSALTREVRSLDVARAALQRGDPAGALAQLDRHDREFENGAMRTESAVLRVDALAARGDKQAAQTLAKQLLLAHPAGPHAKHLKRFADPEGH